MYICFPEKTENGNISQRIIVTMRQQAPDEFLNLVKKNEKVNRERKDRFCCVVVQIYYSTKKLEMNCLF